MRTKKRGFTLAEVLIVTVIIAVLASLMIPRMTGHAEKARAAEALQVVGSIKRAAEIYGDNHDTYILPDGVDEVCSDPWNTDDQNEGSWAALGLSGIKESKNWKYHYYGFPDSFTVQARNEVSGDTMMYYSSDEHWACSLIFKPIEPAAPGDINSTKGCKI